MATCATFTDSGELVEAVGDLSECAAVVLTGDEWARYFTPSVVPVDVAQASQVFSFFFGVTLAIWLIAKKCGLVIQAVRRW
jgi:hypothetical protein